MRATGSSYCNFIASSCFGDKLCLGYESGDVLLDITSMVTLAKPSTGYLQILMIIVVKKKQGQLLSQVYLRQYMSLGFVFMRKFEPALYIENLEFDDQNNNEIYKKFTSQQRQATVTNLQVIECLVSSIIAFTSNNFGESLLQDD